MQPPIKKGQHTRGTVVFTVHNVEGHENVVLDVSVSWAGRKRLMINVKAAGQRPVTTKAGLPDQVAKEAAELARKLLASERARLAAERAYRVRFDRAAALSKDGGPHVAVTIPPEISDNGRGFRLEIYKRLAEEHIEETFALWRRLGVI